MSGLALLCGYAVAGSMSAALLNQLSNNPIIPRRDWEVLLSVALFWPLVGVIGLWMALYNASNRFFKKLFSRGSK